jgi:phenylacetate-CoA ligase
VNVELPRPKLGSPGQRLLEPDIEAMPRPELEAFQFARLREIIQIAYDAGGLVREKWDAAGIKPEDIGSLADFSRAPFISKDEIRAYRERTGDPFGGMLCVPEDTLGTITGTSGTTGDPTLISRPGFDVFGPTISRHLWEWGLRPGDVAVNINFGVRGPSFKFFTDYGMPTINVDHDPAELPRLVDMMRRLKPKLFYMLSTPLIGAFEVLETETGIDLSTIFSPMKAVVFGGEPLGPRARTLTEKWGMNIYEMMATGDTAIAEDCSYHEGVHAWEDEVLIEHIDQRTGEVGEDGGYAEMVVTSLLNRTDPMVRFRSDDLIWLTRAPCKCGRTHARYRIIGRAGDEVSVNGRLILPRDVWPAIDSHEETQAALFQIVRENSVMERLRVRVGHTGPPSAALQEKVEAAIRSLLDVPVEVELTPNSELLKLGPPHKIPRIVKA